MKLYLEKPIGVVIQEEVFKFNISLNDWSDKVFISEKQILKIFNSKSIDLDLLYRWSCLLKIDFFSLYSEHLVNNNFEINKKTLIHIRKFCHIENFINNEL